MSGVLAVLERARHLGLLGPGPVGTHVQHALAMAQAVGSLAPRFADLGSGGGVPALVLMEAWPESESVLIEASQRRAHFLRDAIHQLGWEARARVVEARAEEVGRDPAHRGAWGLVTARSFSAPAVTAECGAPLLCPDGLLVVSEPPGRTDRWPPSGLAPLGLQPDPTGGLEVDGFHFARLRRSGECSERFPRRTGVPSRRPLF